MRRRLANVCTLVGGLLLFAVVFTLARAYLDSLSAATALQDFPVLSRPRLAAGLVLGGIFAGLGVVLRNDR